MLGILVGDCDPVRGRDGAGDPRGERARLGEAGGRRRGGDAVDGPPGRAHQAETTGARDGRARRSVGATRGSNRRRPDLRPRRRRSHGNRAGGQSRGAAHPRHRRAALGQAVSRSAEPGHGAIRFDRRGLEGRLADRPPHHQARRRQDASSRCHGVADRGHRRRTASRGLPVHRPDRGRRARRTVAPQGSAGAIGRADRRPRARVQERPRHDSRIRAPARSGDVARTGAHVRRRHSRRNDRARRSRHQLPALCAAGRNDDGAGRAAIGADERNQGRPRRGRCGDARRQFRHDQRR